jgi:hypothetical protein
MRQVASSTGRFLIQLGGEDFGEQSERRADKMNQATRKSLAVGKSH